MVKNNPPAPGPLAPKRPYVLPLAISLVSLVLVALILAMGGLNYRALQKFLVELVVKDAGAIIHRFDRIVDYEIDALVKPSRHYHESRRGSHRESSERFFQSLLEELTELAVAAGRQASGNDEIRDWAERQGIAVVAVFDQTGTLLFENDATPEGLRRRVRPVVAGKIKTVTNLLDERRRTTERPFVATFDQASGRTTLLLMDGDGYHRRCLRFAVQEALDYLADFPGLAYFLVVDQDGQTLGVVGEPPEGPDVDVRELGSVSGADELTTRKIVTGEHRFVEVESSPTLRRDDPVTLRVGLDGGEAFRLLHESNRTLLLATASMVGLTLLSMGLLFRSQKRHLAGIQRMERRISQAERLSALGRLASGVAHEIRNPLNAISMAVQRLQREHPHRLVDVLRDEIGRLNQIVEEFFSFAGTRKMVLRPHDLTALLEPMVLLLKEEAAARGVEVTAEWPPSSCRVAVDPDKIKQAFLNLLKNAIESIADEGTVTIAARLADAGSVTVEIRDTGAGMDESERARVFDLDYTTKDKGLGLGLPLAHEIVQAHGGAIAVASEPGRGSCFAVRLPLDDDSTSTE